MMNDESDEWWSTVINIGTCLAHRQLQSPALNFEAPFSRLGGDIFSIFFHALDDDDEQTDWIILDGIYWIIILDYTIYCSFRWPWWTRPTCWSVLACGARQALWTTTCQWLNFSKGDVWTDDHDRCRWVEAVYPKHLIIVWSCLSLYIYIHYIHIWYYIHIYHIYNHIYIYICNDDT